LAFTLNDNTILAGIALNLPLMSPELLIVEIQNRLLLVDQRSQAASVKLTAAARLYGLVIRDRFFDLYRWHRSLCTKNKPGVSLPFP